MTDSLEALPGMGGMEICFAKGILTLQLSLVKANYHGGICRLIYSPVGRVDITVRYNIYFFGYL